MQLVHLPASERKPAPWKNGGGSTEEAAVSPAGASMDTFDWRISIATVSEAGDFSKFEGIDRHLTLLRGKLLLTSEGQTHTLLPGESLAFDGGAPFHGDPGQAPAMDLNIMTRRGSFDAEVARLSDSEAHNLAPGSGFFFALAPAIVAGRQLAETDLLRFETDAPESIRIAGGPVLLIKFLPQQPGPSPDRP
ncbi:HutD family protein [Hyphomonas sp. WL0036]|uniref:HutD/Ves family protein n=1 Tax=Hyphomonas sediminis TaxID=2866160 RepID=UPI001C7FB7C0|nr:HutD family protein [Hyphomonas sediminis]MBY9065312.1 HutD family protein [Hyphomonas sediminis]